MKDCNTLVIVESHNGGRYAACDVVDGMRWSCGASTEVIVVPCHSNGNEFGPQEAGFTRVGVPVHNAPSGFYAAAALQWVINEGLQFRQVFMVDDHCLVTGMGLGAWGLDQAAKGCQLIGVRDFLDYHDRFDACAPLLAEWGLPHENWEVTKPTLADGFYWLSSQAAANLFQANALAVPQPERWCIPFGAYLSWAAQMLGMYQVTWGQSDKQLPPFYIRRVTVGPLYPPPHILSAQFWLYRPARHAENYSEEALREIYKRVRGERYRPVPPLTPVVTPSVDTLTELG